MSQIAQYRGTGKRKTSVARVILRPGDGSTWVNGRTLEEYFPRSVWQTIAVSPLKVAGVEGQYNLRVRVHGGGLKARPLREQLERQPAEVLRKAVKGMLPKNKLAARQLLKLKIYAGPEHPHEAQAPQPLEVR